MSKTLRDFRMAVGFPQEDNNLAEKFSLAGGLDTEETAALGDPGKLIFCNNYEPAYSGGYRSRGGTEPVDGQTQPSAFVYQAVLVTVTNSANLPTVGLFCLVPGFSGKGVYYLGSENVNGTNYMIFTCLLQGLMTSYYGGSAVDNDFRGTLSAGNQLVAQGFGNFGTVVSATFLPDNAKSYSYITQARTLIRNRIKPVGAALGAGKALGVFDWNGSLLGFRNNVGGTAAQLFVADRLNSWGLINLGFILYYTLNTKQINVGDTLTGATSGATAIVTNVVLMFGTIGGGDALGYVTCTTTTGVFVVAENLQVAAATIAKTPASGNVRVANTLPPNGSYRFRRWNFTGVANNIRLYGVNGVGTAFELSNLAAGPLTVTFTPLITGVGLTAATFNATPALDTPTTIETWQDQLFLGYPDGNLLHSGYQTPTNWTAVQGADQRTLGEPITNMLADVNNAMLITTRNRVRMLYGDVNENFQLRDLATTFGAFANTSGRINGATFLTDEGVAFYDQSDQFGNFASTTISQPIASMLKAIMAAGAGVVEATITRNRSLYRLYFDGGVCLSFCIVGNEFRGIGLCNYGQNVHNFWSAPSTIPVNDSTTAPAPGEKIYFCGDDGYVYQDDTGSTFGAAGNAISYGCQTQFYYGQDNIDSLKYYRRVYIDITGADAYTNLQVGAEFDDGYGYRTPEVLETVTRALTGSFYDQSGVYGISFYGGAGKNVLRKELHNTGVALSLIFQGSSTVAFPHTLQSITTVKAIRTRRNWR